MESRLEIGIIMGNGNSESHSRKSQVIALNHERGVRWGCHKRLKVKAAGRAAFLEETLLFECCTLNRNRWMVY